MKSFSKEDGPNICTSCWILSFKFPINRSNKLSYGIPSTMRLNFWNCWMCSITRPFFLRFINRIKKESLLTSSWYDINSSVKMDQEMMVFFLHSHSHWYHTNCNLKELLHLEYPCDEVLAIKIPHVDLGDLNTPCGPSLIKSYKTMLINGWFLNMSTIFIIMSTLDDIILFRNLFLLML